MVLVSSILSALLFAAFVPGVLATIPKHSSRGTVLLVHAVLFSFVTTAVMHYYWNYISEMFANYGGSCPKTHVPGLNQKGEMDCLPNPAGNDMLKSHVLTK
jgi:hypothetical protein